MTVEERRLLTALANCRLPHGSPHKGLCLKILKAVTKSGRYRLTGEQRATLWRLGHYYRARLPEDVQDILNYRNGTQSQVRVLSPPPPLPDHQMQRLSAILVERLSFVGIGARRLMRWSRVEASMQHQNKNHG
jgi:hypothetical protein